MKQALRMPKLGLTMTEGQLQEWSVAPAQRFDSGQTLFVVETDKVANDVCADAPGVLLEVVHPAGTVVAVGEIVGWWDDWQAAAARDVEGAHGAAPRAAPPTTPAATGRTEASDPDGAGRIAGCPSTPGPATRVVATPLARRTARELDLPIASVPGSGPAGRIKAADVRAAAGRPAEALAATTPPTTASDDTHRVQPTPVQLAAARRLEAVQREVPHFYLSVDADVGALLALRAALPPSPRVTLTHLVIAAVGQALRVEPSANRLWIDSAFVQLRGTAVGMAVDTPAGLYVPTVRDAGSQPLSALAEQAAGLATRAREGRLLPADTTAAAVTVSNAGMQRVRYMTPMVGPGQSMTLGVGSVVDLFVPDAQGRPVVSRQLGLVLACDHRVLDGVGALRWLRRVVEALEEPGLLQR